MRRVTFTVEPTDGAFHPVSRRLVEEQAVTPEAVHHVEYLTDGTLAMLAEVRGDPDRYRKILADAEDVVEAVVSAGDDRAIGYCHLVPNELTREMFERRRDGEFVVEFPIEYTPEGHQRYTVVAPDDVIAGGIDAPDGVSITVESVRPYDPDVDGPFDALTAREREVLSVALDAGYYEVPRKATQAEVAESFEVSKSAVGRHLRRIEAKVLQAFR